MFAVKSVVEFLTLYNYNISRIKLIQYRYHEEKKKFIKVRTLLFDGTDKLYCFCDSNMELDSTSKPIIHVQHYTYVNENNVSQEIPIPDFKGQDYYTIAEMSMNMVSDINKCQYHYDMFYNNYNVLKFIDKSEIKKSIMSDMNVIIKDENKKQLKKTILNLEKFIDMIKDMKYNHNRLDYNGINYSINYFNDKLNLLHKDKTAFAYVLRNSTDYDK